MTSMARVIVALCAPGALGCQTELVTPVTVDRVTVDPVEVRIAEGDAVQFSAAVFGEDDASLSAAAVAWSSDRPDIVAVEPDGTARALSEGSARVTASFNGVSGWSRVIVLSSADCASARGRDDDRGKGKKDKDDDDDDEEDDDEEDDDDEEEDDDESDEEPDDGDTNDDGDSNDGAACTAR